MSNLTQGALANDSGKTFEGAIEDALTRRGFEVAKQVVVGQSIYDTPTPFPSVVYYLGDDISKFFYAFDQLGDIWQRVEPAMFGS